MICFTVHVALPSVHKQKQMPENAKTTTSALRPLLLKSYHNVACSVLYRHGGLHLHVRPIKPKKRATIAFNCLCQLPPRLIRLTVPGVRIAYCNDDDVILDEEKHQPREQDTRATCENVECEVRGRRGVREERKDAQGEVE